MFLQSICEREVILDQNTTYKTTDLKDTVTNRRLLGLWRLMRGYRWHYLGAALSLGVSALARTGTYLLLGFFVDTFQNFVKQRPQTVEGGLSHGIGEWISLGFQELPGIGGIGLDHQIEPLAGNGGPFFLQ